MSALPFLTGVALASAVAVFARLAGFDRDRSFYPTILIVVASCYALFAAMAGGGAILAEEAPGLVLFSAAAVIGFRTSPWIIVAALAGHGVFDAFHGALIANPGTPLWWPAFCLSYDLAAAAWLALRFVHPRWGAARAKPRLPEAGGGSGSLSEPASPARHPV